MIGFENAPFGLPSFVRQRPETYQSSGSFGQIFFWMPNRTGYDALDYALGRQHFEAAITFARAIHSNTFLASVFGGICQAGPGSMECGFIDALSIKATYGRLPNMITGNEAFELFIACGTTDDEVRFGEAEAREYLTLARETQCPDVIAALMESVVHREMLRGYLSFFWTVCGAAYLGALN
jgi:hypothetical protein